MDAEEASCVREDEISTETRSHQVVALLPRDSPRSHDKGTVLPGSGAIASSRTLRSMLARDNDEI